MQSKGSDPIQFNDNFTSNNNNNINDMFNFTQDKSKLIKYSRSFYDNDKRFSKNFTGSITSSNLLCKINGLDWVNKF